jgi:glutaredoxin 2
MNSKRLGTVNVQEIATAAAIEALKLQKKEELEQIRKNRFHNTERLLKNYLSLIEHFEVSQDKASEEDLEVYNLGGTDAEDIIIRSIRRSRMRTLVMVLHIEACLGRLRTKMIDKGQLEKYVVIEKMYLDPVKGSMTLTERKQLIAIEIPCGETSVWKWRNEMISELSVLLFGVDGLRLEV